MNENWSIKLQVNGGGVPLYNEWEMVYKSAQTGYKLTQGKTSIMGQEPIVVTHQSDSTAAVLARAIEQNKVLTLEISILDNVHTAAAFDWDTALNNVHTLARHLSGATSTAVRAASGGQNVRIAIKPDTATYTTYYDVQWGSVNTSASYYLAESQQGSTQVGTKGAWFCPVTLTLKDGGYGDSFTLRNDLASSPHMIEDSNADGLADGLALVGAPVAVTYAAGLTGGVSQKFTTDNASDQGVEITSTSRTACSAGQNVVAYVDLLTVGDPVSVILRDNVGVIQTKVLLQNDTTAVSSRSMIGVGLTNNAITWYRVEVSGVTAVGATTVYLQVRRGSATATQITLVYIDKMYLQLDATTVPPAFVSSSSLKNRYDPASTSAATRQQINYLDVWGVPGDLPAYAKLDMTLSSALGYSIASRYNYSGNLPTQYQHTFDDTGMLKGNSLLAAAWASVVDATCLGGNYIHTNTGAIWTNLPYFGLDLTTAATPIFNSRPCRLYVRCRKVGTGTVTVGTQFSLSELAATFVRNETDITIDNKWLLVDLGLFMPNNNASYLPMIAVGGKLNIVVESTNTTTDFQVDGVFAFPVQADGEFILYSSFDTGVAINGNIEEVYSTVSGSIYNVLGSLWRLLPQEENRIINLTYSNSNDMTLSVTDATSLTVTPRTSHLLGTA